MGHKETGQSPGLPNHKGKMAPWQTKNKQQKITVMIDANTK
jgi:hypothetical protein